MNLTTKPPAWYLLQVQWSSGKKQEDRCEFHDWLLIIYYVVVKFIESSPGVSESKIDRYLGT